MGRGKGRGEGGMEREGEGKRVSAFEKEVVTERGDEVSGEKDCRRSFLFIKKLFIKDVLRARHCCLLRIRH